MQESVKIPCSVMVSGLTETTSDDEVSTYLQKYGSIKRHSRIDDPKSDFHKHIIVEFTHDTAMESLEPLLPLKLQNPTETDTVYEVKSLASVYTLDARSRVTKTYMEQLCDIAKLSGTSLEQILKEELARLALSTDSTSSPSPQSHQEPSSKQSPLSQPEPPDQENVSFPPHPHSVEPSDPAARRCSLDAVQPHTSSTFTKNLTEFTLSPTPPVYTSGTTQSAIDVNPPLFNGWWLNTLSAAMKAHHTLLRQVGFEFSQVDIHVRITKQTITHGTPVLKSS